MHHFVRSCANHDNAYTGLCPGKFFCHLNMTGPMAWILVVISLWATIYVFFYSSFCLFAVALVSYVFGVEAFVGFVSCLQRCHLFYLLRSCLFSLHSGPLVINWWVIARGSRDWSKLVTYYKLCLYEKGHVDYPQFLQHIICLVPEIGCR